jgi:hypothetical protein
MAATLNDAARHGTARSLSPLAGGLALVAYFNPMEAAVKARRRRPSLARRFFATGSACRAACGRAAALNWTRAFSVGYGGHAGYPKS